MAHPFRFSVVAVLASVLCAATALAQPPEGGPGGERRGPPSPERMVEHAMKFDADGDGKLDRSELTKFAEEFHAMRQRGGPGGPGGAGGPGRPGGGRGPGRGSRPGGGDRPGSAEQPDGPK